MNKRNITVAEILHEASKLASTFSHIKPKRKSGIIGLYGVPRGGIPAAFYLQMVMTAKSELVYDISEADIIIDDLVDSGATAGMYKKLTPGIPFCALFNKGAMETTDWLVFPWEIENEAAGPEDAVIRLLEFIGEDPNREGLIETPKRVIKAWAEWTEGYGMKLEDIIKVFKDGAEGIDEMVMEKRIPFTSHCEHHMAPFTGYVTIAYIPNGSILGLSKFNRVTEMFSRRLQVQERMTKQIADALESTLNPLGVAVMVEAEHSCVCSRGVRHHGCLTVTSALRGVFKTQPETRAEFYALCNNKG